MWWLLLCNCKMTNKIRQKMLFHGVIFWIVVLIGALIFNLPKLLIMPYTLGVFLLQQIMVFTLYKLDEKRIDKDEN